MIDQTGRVPCQGLDFGYVIAKRPPLSDFALSPTRIFKIDTLGEALVFSNLAFKLRQRVVYDIISPVQSDLSGAILRRCPANC